MNYFGKQMASSPEYARFVPLFVFSAITGAGFLFGHDWKFWLYAVKVFVGVWMVWEMRPYVPEMRWAVSWEAIVVGIAAFVIWVGIDPYYPMNELLFKNTKESLWNPFERFGYGSGVAWTLIVIRIAGMTFVVPPLEEVFYRSMFYRFLIRYDFLTVAMGHFDGIAFVSVAIFFGFVHYEWLPGIICGVAYQWLVLRKGRLGDAMTAHAITNCLLGIYVVWKGGEAWKFF